MANKRGRRVPRRTGVSYWGAGTVRRGVSSMRRAARNVGRWGFHPGPSITLRPSRGGIFGRAISRFGFHPGPSATLGPRRK